MTITKQQLIKEALAELRPILAMSPEEVLLNSEKENPQKRDAPHFPEEGRDLICSEIRVVWFLVNGLIVKESFEEALKVAKGSMERVLHFQTLFGFVNTAEKDSIAHVYTVLMGNIELLIMDLAELS